MPDVAFVARPGGPRADLAAVVGAELTRQGMDVSWHETFPPVHPTRLCVLVDPVEWVRQHGERLLPGAGTLHRTVFLSAADPAVISSQRELYARAGRVFDVGEGALAALRRARIDGRLLRPGYVLEWDHFDRAAPRPVDLVRMGGVTTAPALVTELASARVAVVPASGGRPAMLDITRAMHAGAVVVSEHAAGMAPFVAGEHLFVASQEALPSVVDGLLRDDALLARVRLAAHERLRAWLPFTASVAMLRASLLELVGRPCD